MGPHQMPPHVRCDGEQDVAGGQPVAYAARKDRRQKSGWEGTALPRSKQLQALAPPEVVCGGRLWPSYSELENGSDPGRRLSETPRGRLVV